MWYIVYYKLVYDDSEDDRRGINLQFSLFSPMLTYNGYCCVPWSISYKILNSQIRTRHIKAHTIIRYKIYLKKKNVTKHVYFSLSLVLVFTTTINLQLPFFRELPFYKFLKYYCLDIIVCIIDRMFLTFHV